jgi:light-regulated signal transduction histidine kinase (bacteriophytochrome)/CheY-like chemotaxis protein
MSYGTKTYTVNDCDREPIHQIGEIQPFGALIAIRADWVIAHRSTNCSAILGVDDDPSIGQALKDYFSAPAIGRLRDAIAKLPENDAVERLFGISLRKDSGQFDVSVHQSGSLTIIEFEPHATKDYADHIALIGPLMAQLEPIQSIPALCDKAAELLRDILGYDRVMVYRFHADESGEVIAESRADAVNSFLGLRYPRADIPQQARVLYLRNPFRIIADVQGERIPIEPQTSLNGEPLDLSMSALRAHSKMHLEYMRNMGVDASLSISIGVKGKLWGMFACHHSQPRNIPYSLRTVAELFSQMFALLLDRSLINQGERLRAQGRKIHDKLMIRLAEGTSMLECLPQVEEVLADIIPHDGASAYVSGVYRANGSTPTAEEFEALLPALSGAPVSTIIAMDSLVTQLKSARSFADRAAGALIIPISRTPRDFLVLWRKELRQTIVWAGNPEKTIKVANEGGKIQPRQSFAAWEESVTGRSAEWSNDEKEIAESLRITLLEVVLRLTDVAVQERTKAQEQQELLIAELNHRVRNILNLIRSLIDQSKHEAHDIPTFTEIVSGRISALATAHDNITRENWAPASVYSLVEAEVAAYLQQKKDRLKISGEDVLVSPEAYTVLALVIHEMATNSAKYGSLCDRRGHLEIDLTRDSDGDLSIAWNEIGGPKVKEPTRRGFGSTIIERSIPFELKGYSKVRFEPDGLRANFVIPSKYISAKTAKHEQTQSGENSGRGRSVKDARLENLPRNVLIVEDSIIIAMDTEECLRSIGIPKVDMAASVAGAMEVLGKGDLDFAIVDYNLGSETSDPIIEELNRLGVPFVLATGYGEMADKLENGSGIGILRKPYSKADLEQVVGATN